LSQAIRVWITAAATADQPSTGLMAKIRIRKTIETGASMQAISTGVLRNSRTVLKSFMGCAVPPGMRFMWASKMALKMRPLMRWSSAMEAWCIS